MGKKIDGVAHTYYSTFMNGGKNYRGNPAADRETLIASMYERLLAELCVSRFKWTGLPPEIDVRHMELSLYFQGLSVFYKNHALDKYFAVRAAASGYVNVLDQPTSYTVIANSGTYNPDSPPAGKRISHNHCVPIWANALRMPDWDTVRIYASKLANFDRTIEINAKNARTTKILFSSEDTKLSILNMVRQYDTGAEIIQATSNSVMDSVSVLDFEVEPTGIEKMHIVRTRLWNELMGLLGLDNANQDKKERLVASEVDANDEQVTAMKRVSLNQRKFAAEQINRKYGLDVDVEFYQDAPPIPSILTGGIDIERTDEI